VIPTKDAGPLLRELLERLVAQKTPFPCEIVAVDSGSRDGTLATLRAFPVRVHEIRPAEFDHGETRNLGARLASGDALVFLNQDALPADEHLLENLVGPFADPSVAAVYGRQIPRPDCDVVTARQLDQWLTGRGEPARAALDGAALDALAPAARHQLCTFDTVCGAVRRSAWEEIPFAQTDFGEDIAWGKAAIEAGFAIAYEPRAAVIHSHRRGLGYELGRGRISHAKLARLFGLELVPTRRALWHAISWNLRNELPYAWRHAPRGLERARQLARVAGLSVVGPLGQYLGARDARRSGP